MQYSDDAKTEFKLNTYHDKGIVISALQTVRYRGGNTKTGTPLKKNQSGILTNSSKEDEFSKFDVLCALPFLLILLLHPGIALKHVFEKVFTSDSGMRRNVPKVLVVVTDGRSQDDVKKSAEKLQHSGLCGFITHCHVCFGLRRVYSTHCI